MSFIGTIIAKVIEYFVALFAKFVSDKWRQKKEIENDEALASANAEKVDNAKTHEEKVREAEGLLNGEN